MNNYWVYGVLGAIVIGTLLAWLKMRKLKDFRGIGLFLYGLVALLSAVLIYFYSFAEKLMYPLQSYESLFARGFLSDTWVIKVHEATGVIFLLGAVLLFLELKNYLANTKKYESWIVSAKIRTMVYWVSIILMVLIFIGMAAPWISLPGVVIYNENRYYVYLMYVIVPFMSRVEYLNRKAKGKKMPDLANVNYGIIVFMSFPFLMFLLSVFSLTIGLREPVIRVVYDLGFSILAMITVLANYAEYKQKEAIKR